jgi:tetratricopeptide (TPR) repeat protein
MLTRSLLGLSADSSAEFRRAAAEKAEGLGLLRDGERASLRDLLDLPAEGEDRVLIQAMDEPTRQARRRALLAALVTRLARERPMLAAIEDLHWADPILLEDLAFVGAATVETPLLLALSTRPEGDPLDRAWRAKLGPAAVSTIDLAPLTPSESALLAQAHLKSGDERIAACIERAGGNPFFLEQLLRHTGEVASAAVPASVQSLVLGRADRLPAEEKRALQTASVLGQRMPIEALRHLLGNPSYDAHRLIDQQFMRREGSELVFVHALVRDGIYGSLLKARRRELHRMAAAWYGEQDLALRAQHLGLGEAEEASAAYLAAAEAAAGAYRFDQALDLATQGLALVRESETRVALASTRGELLHVLGRTEESVTALDMVAKEATPGRPRLRAWLTLAHGLSVLDRLDEALALLSEAESEAKANGLTIELSRIHTLRGNIHFPRGEIDQCLAAHGEALRLAELSGAMEEQARALGGLADAYYMRGLYRTSGEMFRRCVALSAAQGFRRVEAANLPMVAMMSMFDLRLAEAFQQDERAIALADQIGHRRAAMIARHGHAFLFLEMGQPERALEAGMAALEIAEALGARRFIGEGLIIKAICEHFLGDPRAAATILEAEKISREQPAYMLPFVLSTQARMTDDPEVRAAKLAEGETLMAQGAVRHNDVFFNRTAIDCCIDARDWDSVDRYAGALEHCMAEPLPMTDFLVARARALAAAGRGEKNGAELRGLIAQARTVGWNAVLPALEAALGDC